MAIPGSHCRKLEAMTGMPVIRDLAGVWHMGGFASSKEDEQDACEQIRRRHWKHICEDVFRSQGYQCADCGRIKPLEGHHVIYRSRWRRSDGPLDIASNIRGLCSDCHGTEHRPKPNIIAA